MTTDQRTCNHPKCTWTGFDGTKNQPDGRHPISPQCPANLTGKQISMPPPHTDDLFVSIVDGWITTGSSFYGYNWRSESTYRNRGPFIPLEPSEIEYIKERAADQARDDAERKAKAALKAALGPLRKLAGNDD